MRSSARGRARRDRVLAARSGRDHVAPRRLRRRGHQGRGAGGRLRAPDDLADRCEGTSLLHLHLNRGKQSLVLDLKQPEAVAVFEELVRDVRRRDRGDAPGFLDKMGLGYDRLKELNPEDRDVHDLGLRRHRPVPRPPEPRHRLRRVVGHHPAGRRRRRASAASPTRPTSASPPAPRSARSAILAALVRAEKTGEGACMEIAQSDAAAYFDWYRIETWKGYDDCPDDEVTGNPSDDYERRAAGPRRHVGGRPLPVLRVVRRAHPVHGVGAGVLEELLRGRRPHGPVREVAGQDASPTTPAATRELQAILRDIFRTRTIAGVDRLRRRAQHHDRPGEHRRRRCATTRSSRTGSAGRPTTTPAPTCCCSRCTSRVRSCRCPPRRPTVGEHTEQVLRSRARLRRRQARATREAGALG